MKKIITITISILPVMAAQAQKINEKEARHYLETAWGYLKTSDSVAFVNLWMPDDSVWQRIHTPLEGIDYMKRFYQLQEFLFPAIISEADIDHIEIGKEDGRGTEIIAMFKTRLHGDMGFSFHVIKIHDKWSARGKPHFLATIKENK